jgi:predicted HAD superfamily Cof-like phosphohydrolase
MQDKIVEVFEEIQRSNMSKLGEDGLPILREDGKILKGNNYSKPDIKSILEQKK